MDRRTQLYSQLQDASMQNRDANIAAHKLRTGRIKRSASRLKTFQQAKKQTTLPKVALDFLAIGDSWFEYPSTTRSRRRFRTMPLLRNRNLDQWGIHHRKF
jgi:hypothetical protein